MDRQKEERPLAQASFHLFSDVFCRLFASFRRQLAVIWTSEDFGKFKLVDDQLTLQSNGGRFGVTPISPSGPVTYTVFVSDINMTITSAPIQKANAPCPIGDSTQIFMNRLY